MDRRGRVTDMIKFQHKHQGCAPNSRLPDNILTYNRLILVAPVC
jgi:hypothetical protein